jgi:hypothetical protein
MISGDLHDLDPIAVLTAMGGSVRTRREAAVDEILLVLQWADLHSGDPQDQPGAVPIRQGGDRLVQLGGEGTPMASEFCWAELAIAREAGVIATRNLAADALDLRHRLPLTWTKVRELRIEAWVARRIATMTRALAPEAAGLVDLAVAAGWQQPAGRLLALAEAKTIEADIAAHEARIAADAERTGFWLSRPRTGDILGGQAGAAEAATRGIGGRLALADAVELDATIDDLADALARHVDYQDLTRDQLRAAAVALLARPEQALAFLRGEHDLDDTRPEEPVVEKRPRRSAVIHFHISDATLTGTGIVRSDLGPLLVDQVRDLVRHRDVTVQRVIDLNAVHAVNGYEHPAQVRARTLLRTLGDVFPHSTGSSTRLDQDHVIPYDPLGPPGQTGDRNTAPLTRLHHRVKTHAPGWQSKQLGLGAYRWTTPHGLTRVVTPLGTRDVEPIQDHAGHIIGELYFH